MHMFEEVNAFNPGGEQEHSTAEKVQQQYALWKLGTGHPGNLLTQVAFCDGDRGLRGGTEAATVTGIAADPEYERNPCI